MMKKLPALMAACAALGPSVSAQDPRPRPPVVFEVEVRYVEVDAIVTDKDGNPVRDLKKEDFQVLENGVGQSVDLFSYVDIPVERREPPLGETPLPEPDVVTNARPFDGRLYVLVLDDYHTAALRSGLVKRAAKSFIETRLGENDLAAVIHTSGRTDAGQNLTANRALLVQAVDKFIGRKLQSAIFAKIEEYQRLKEQGIQVLPEDMRDQLRDPEDFQRGHHARSALDTLKASSEWLAGIHGRRKAILYFTEGIDYDVTDPFSNREGPSIREAFRQTVAAAARSNVSVYSVDPRGLDGMGHEVMGLIPVDNPNLGLNEQGLRQEIRFAQDGLRSLSEETSGLAAVNTNDLEGAFDRIVADNSSYYMLGYYPTDEKRDGRYRKIEVRVTRPGVKVRARTGYVAAKGKAERVELETPGETSPALMQVVRNPLPQSGLPMAVQATPFKGEGDKASILLVVQIVPGALRLTEKAGVFKDDVEIATLAFDAAGKLRSGERRMINLELKPQTRQAVDVAGLRLLSRMDLAPGRYQIRVAARAGNTGAAGSIHHQIDVPDFAKESLSLSGVALTSSLAAITPTARPDERLQDVLPGPATTWRGFSTRDTLGVFTEVYTKRDSRPQTVDLLATLRREDDTVVFTRREERGREELGSGRAGFGLQIPLQELETGTYVLRVEAKSRVSGVAPAVREVPIRVQAAAAPASE